MHIVTCEMRTGIVMPAETAVDGNGSVNISFARQWLSGRHMTVLIRNNGTSYAL
jgi:hypothetical protein